jgi:hypothetical protein
MPLVIRFVVLGVVAGLGYLVKKSTEKEEWEKKEK